MGIKSIFYEFSDFGLKMAMLHAGAKISGKFDKYQKYRMKVIDSKTSEELIPAIKHFYTLRMNYDFDFEKPQTINEKIQWLKAYGSTPLKTTCADKYLAREYVKEKIGEEYLIPLLGVWDSFDEIDFNLLPEKFVLKTNHACGGNLIVKDKAKLNFKDAREKFKNWLSYNPQVYDYYELHYRDIPKKIIAEEYIEQVDGNLNDYKFYCSYGEVLFVLVVSDRYTGHKENYYTTDWSELDISLGGYPKNPNIKRPRDLDCMIRAAKQLSKDFAFVRVDFYDLATDTIGKNGVLFGELTFASASGTDSIEPKSFDLDIARIIKLPNKFVLCAKK